MNPMNLAVSLSLCFSLLAGCAADDGSTSGPGAGAGGKADGTLTCADVGGQCHLTWNRENSPPRCEGAGLITADAACPVAGNTCCVTAEPVPTCAELAGHCMGSLFFPTSAPSCEQEYGLVTAKGECAALNESCCVAPPPPPTPTCADLGGQCMGSLFFPTSAPSCEQEYGLVTADGECAALNESCCVAPPQAP